MVLMPSCTAKFLSQITATDRPLPFYANAHEPILFWLLSRVFGIILEMPRKDDHGPCSSCFNFGSYDTRPVDSDPVLLF